jgi:hypothetical protein
MLPHDLNNRISLAQNLVIPKSQHREPVFMQPVIALSVTVARQVLSAVNLDDQHSLEADEISDELADRCLAPELEAQLSVS